MYLMNARTASAPILSGDWVGVEFAVFDGLLAFGLAIETDDLDLVGLSGVLQGGARAEGGRIVDGEESVQIGMSLDEILRGFETLRLVAAAGKLGHDMHLHAALLVQFCEFLLEAP